MTQYEISNMSKDEVINAMNNIDEKISDLKREKQILGEKLIESFCPFKIGQKAKYTRIETKNVGTWFNPQIVETKRKEEILVCISINNATYSNSEFNIKLKRIHPDGTLTQNEVHVPKDELEWLDEYYDLDKIK